MNEKPAARAKARAMEVNLKVVSQVSQKADQKVDRKEEVNQEAKRVASPKPAKAREELAGHAVHRNIIHTIALKQLRPKAVMEAKHLRWLIIGQRGKVTD